MKVLLDPGHPTYPGNNGATARSLVESVWTLDRAREIWEVLRRKGIECDLTRHDRKTAVSLRKRAEASRNYDLYISLHIDKVKDKRACGLVTYVKRSDQVGKRYAQAISDEYGHPGKYVFNDRVHARSGRPLYAENHKRVLNVLKRVECPSVLVEAGYMSNDRDYRRLTNEYDEIVSAIVRAVALNS